MSIRSILSSLASFADAESELASHPNDDGWILTGEIIEARDLDQIVSLVQDALPDEDVLECRVVRLRKKLRKLFFEILVQSTAGTRRYIGKVYRSDRGQAQFDALRCLRAAGFCPPSSLTVVEPLTYLAEQCLLVVEKAPGKPLGEFVYAGGATAKDALARAATWLTTLHGKVLDGASRVETVANAVSRYGRELATALPREATRLERLTTCALTELRSPSLELVPSHGDFHSNNIFVSDDGRVTLIDLDTFGLQESVADVAYFLAQTAIMGYHHYRSFTVSQEQRAWFLRCYCHGSSAVRNDRLAVHLAIAFLQSLHYEICVLHTRNFGIVEPWLGNIDRFLFEQEVTLMDNPGRQTMRLSG
jgi:hypothetical protein